MLPAKLDAVLLLLRIAQQNPHIVYFYDASISKVSHSEVYLAGF